MAEPAVFGEFAIESMIGEGGTGKVYRARQTKLDRCVALKVFPKLKANKEFVERFYNEARLAARLVHPNIVQIYSVAEQDGLPYFAMEYIEGIDLESLMRNHPAPFIAEEAVEIVRCVVKALAISYDNGIVHRNIQPSTIMITKNGVVKVTDFGSGSGGDMANRAGLLVGAPEYMSPEQSSGRNVDIRSDIYSLGCVFYECLCDHPPYSGDPSTLLHKHAMETPEKPHKYHADLDAEIEKICLVMLAKNPIDRYQNPSQVLTALSVMETGTIGEMLLAKRVELVLRARNPDSARGHGKVPTTVILPSDSSAPAPAASAAVPPAPPPASAPLSAGNLPALPPSKSPAKSSGAMPYIPPAKSSAFVKAVAASASGSAVLSIKTQSGRQTPSAFVSKSSCASQPAVVVEAIPSASGAQAKAVLDAVKAQPTKPNEIFTRLGDGRWTYRVELGKCHFAEGLAADVPAKKAHTSEEEGLGDCLLCSNWNKRLGCAMALNLEIEARNKTGQLKPIVEQAIAWTGAGRFDMAVALLDDYVKTNPLDPEGYRELARIYDRPDYNGKNKRRAVVLYRRFVELAKEYNVSTPFEINRAEERAKALMGTWVESKGAGVTSSTGITFQCYLRPANCYAFGVMTANWLLLCGLGETDPDTGQGPPELGGAVEKATRVFKRFKSDRVKKVEADAAKTEIARLTELSPDALRGDATCVAAIMVAQVVSATTSSIPGNAALRMISIKDAHHSYDLVFGESMVFKSEQCLELLRRRMPQKKT